MTTTLMPPEVDEQLDAEAVEELTPRCWYYDLWIVPCRAPAVWLVDVRCDTCGDGYVLLCDHHCRRLAEGAETRCYECYGDYIRYVSRSKL